MISPYLEKARERLRQSDDISWMYDDNNRVSPPVHRGYYVFMILAGVCLLAGVTIGWWL